MKPEIERVKDDVETMRRAMGLAPELGREWIEWLKRDRWFGLWWCVPGLILIMAAVLPLDHAHKFFGLVPDQWAGILVALSLVALAIGHNRHVAGRGKSSDGVVREARRINGMTAQGVGFGLALAGQMVLYFVWGKEYHVGFEAFWAGLFLVTGSTCLVAALAARAWLLLGFAIPFLAYGLCLPLVQGHHQVNGVLFGLMFVGVALALSAVQAWQIRLAERAA